MNTREYDKRRADTLSLYDKSLEEIREEALAFKRFEAQMMGHIHLPSRQRERTACGLWHEITTSEEDEVTCPRCLKMIRDSDDTHPEED